MNIKLIVQSVFFAFLVIAFSAFLAELWFQHIFLTGIWTSLSFQQRALENIVLGLADLKLMLAAPCLIFFVRFWGD